MSVSEIERVTEIRKKEIFDLLALPFTVPVEHDASPVHYAGPSLSR